MIKTIIQKKYIQVVGLILGGIVLGCIATFFLLTRSSIKAVGEKSLREVGKYALTAPLLTCGSSDPTTFDSYKPLENSLRNLIQKKKEQNAAQDISIYYRDFQGKWVGINEEDTYAPASLLKVPLMMAYYKQAENHPETLQTELTYDGSFDNNKNETFRSPYDITPGVYKVDDLIKAMIVNSDNNATVLLTQNMDQKKLKDIYSDLNLPEIDTINANSDIISAKQYAYFFRVLYNATYLTADYSEKALELLAKQNFPQGIHGGVPQNTTVAQKFGERSELAATGQVLERELHDCGIVYVPGKPFLLCVMTRGNDFQKLAEVIQEVTRAVYTSIESTTTK